MNEPQSNPTGPTELPRVLGPWLATAIVVGCVIGTGVFKKGRAVSESVPETGPAIAVWVVVGLLTLCGAMALAEIAALFPRAGGNYIFLREAYGRLFGFLWGWVEFWFLRVASCAALASVFSESLNDVLKLASNSESDVLGFWGQQVASALVVTGLGLLAARGTKLGAGVQFAVTTVKVGTILSLILLPLIIVAFVSQPEYPPNWDNYKPVWPADWSQFNLSAFAIAMVAVMWPYNGWSNVAAIAGEVTNPRRNIPIAFIGGLILLIAIYSTVNMAYYSVIPSNQMAQLKDTPVATEFCRRLIGPVGLLVMSAAIMFSVFGALGGNMLVGPRGIFAMSRDGMAPKILGTIHRNYETPFAATLMMTGITAAFIFSVAAYTRFFKADSSKPPFDVITDFITFGGALFETLAVAAIFVFRRRHPEAIANLPYRCPGYPVVPLLFIICFTGVMLNMIAVPKTREEALIGLGFIASGAAVYLLLIPGRSRATSSE